MYITGTKLAKEMGCDVRQINKLRKHGLLTGMRVGHGYAYLEKDVEAFHREYCDYDLSNEEKIILAVQIKKGLTNANSFKSAP